MQRLQRRTRQRGSLPLFLTLTDALPTPLPPPPSSPQGQDLTLAPGTTQTCSVSCSFKDANGGLSPTTTAFLGYSWFGAPGSTYFEQAKPIPMDFASSPKTFNPNKCVYIKDTNM